jgi:predicted 3-demethylubiquinone-9 3-methyltransferase (glyoxalase superfamily)
MLERQKIVPHLWFDDNALEAAEYYMSIFEDAKISKIVHYGDAGPGTPGTVMTVAFEIEGMEIVGINGGPMFQLSEAVSFLINCDTQEEIDRLWGKLGAGGKEQPCGWLKDKFGLSWQFNYSGIGQMMTSDPDRSNRVMDAILKMSKIDVAALKQAYEDA